MESALVVAAGLWPDSTIWRPLVKAADLIIAADGGACLAAQNQVEVDVIIGDMDSLATSDILKHPNAEVIHMQRQDDSDLSKTLKWLALKDGFSKRTRVDIIGVEGGRVDHAFAAFTILFESDVPKAIIWLDGWQVQAVKEEVELVCKNGQIISLFALGKVEGLCIEGLRYNCDNEVLEIGSRGLHNEGLGGLARISHKKGNLLLMKQIK
jgi:thiamine pyrophosphokinase